MIRAGLLNRGAPRESRVRSPLSGLASDDRCARCCSNGSARCLWSRALTSASSVAGASRVLHHSVDLDQFFVALGRGERYARLFAFAAVEWAWYSLSVR